MTFTFEFKGNCPTKPQITKQILAGIKQGAGNIEIFWGENMIEVQKICGKWCGFGWIRRNGGQDLIEELGKSKQLGDSNANY